MEGTRACVPIGLERLGEGAGRARGMSRKVPSLWCFGFQLPDLKDAEAVQKFFLEEIQLGEELLAQGEKLSLCNEDKDSGLVD